ncbi:MAG: glutathione peroxidase [Bacteroidetes bacterium]|nr:glutathione peroxidase [Bacteroidota bacterium]
MNSTSIVVLLLLCATVIVSAQEKSTDRSKGVYDFTLNNIDGKETPLSDYSGKVLLIVNTASKCGYTPQYAPLEKLYRRFHDKGLRILAFPANNFGGQEPGSNAEIKEFCSSNYAVTFDLFEKISVKGEDIHPLYRYLTTETDFPGDIRWNFTKFLVDREGKVVARFETKVDPLEGNVISQIEELLNE